MINTDGMFWSGETLSERLAALIEPFAPERVDCAAYTLSVGPEVYVSPNSQTADPTTVTVRKLAPGDAFTIPPGQFAFLLTEEIVAVPRQCARLQFDPRKDQVPRAGQCLRLPCRSGLSRPTDLRRLQRGAGSDPA